MYLKKARKVILCFVLFLIMTALPKKLVQAAEKQYGILISDDKGKYTYYDFNGETGSQKIECDNGKVMIPLKRVCSYFKDLSYSFDFSTRNAEIVNEKTGKRMVLSENQKYATIYKKGSAKGTKVALSEKSYISEGSGALMVQLSALKYIFKTENGYHYYTKKAMKKAGYDSSLKDGVIVYNQYKKVSSLPKAVNVAYCSDKAVSNIVKVSIPEGYSVPQIFTKLVENGVCQSTQGLFQAMESVDLSKYSIFDGKESKDTVCYPLEGYLYPDTYEFYKNSEPADVLAKMISNSNAKLSQYQEKAQDQGLTLEELLCYASIIEKEAKTKEDRVKVSSVLHTRISVGMKLQCDATIYYVERYVKPYISGDKDRYNSYYNCYKAKGLPAGPICNPSKTSLEAALNPDETAYLYFASDHAGNYYYASNDEEFLKMKDEVNAKNAEIDGAQDESENEE